MLDQRDFETQPMPLTCPTCSKSNPADAYYCYHDGRPLSKDGQAGPVHVGALPFPTKFHFSDGQACGNFNQLALACHSHWEEARTLLGEGLWPTFFGGIGRLDLAAVAKQAAGQPDRDLGLSLLLEKLPADPESLRPAKLALETTEENLGQLKPGADCTFDMVIYNQGMLLLRGMVLLNSDWLVFADHPGPTQRMFQTRSSCVVPLRVIGAKLRAGLKPIEGEIVIDTNGGTLAVPVRAHVAVRPFPAGLYANDVLAGAASPREIAKRAKEHPKEAALLFEQGAVKAWYDSNGWMYPIEGSEGSGKGAVQQFFEALGLTKPPRLEINVTSLAFKGKIGERLSGQVTVSTDEAKPVYAQATCNQEWIKPGAISYLGNKVKIAIEITVPPQPGEIVEAHLTIRGNGKQQFIVPVRVTVDRKSATAVKKQAKADAVLELTELERAEETTSNLWWLPWALWFGGSFLVVGFFVLILVIVVVMVRLSR